MIFNPLCLIWQFCYKESVKKVAVIFGPTASGKTDLAVRLAKEFGGEVVSCDSQQIYRELFIGTARPTENEMDGIVHHLLGHVSVREKYNVAKYLDDVSIAINGVLSRGKLPIVCGGSYMWLMMMIDGISKTPEGDSDLRRKLENEAKENGLEALYVRLQAVDPASASKIKPTDLKRIVRALEIYELSGKTQSELFSEREPLPYDFIKIAITRPREELYERINRRTDEMVSAGLLDEIKAVIKNGLEADVLRVMSHGYPFLIDYFHGRATLEKALSDMKLVTRHYAKRQMTFIRSRQDFNVFDARDFEGICSFVHTKLLDK